MQYNYPHIIDNGAGEQLTFLNYVKDESGGYLEVENLFNLRRVRQCMYTLNRKKL